MAVTFDLFGTLIEADQPTDPAEAVAAELRARGVTVPDDWAVAYREVHVDAPSGAEVPLPAHVSAALASRDIHASGNATRRAVVSAFDPEVRTREGAVEAVEAARERGPVGILSNCSVPELARRALIRSNLDHRAFDAIVTSVACGWRKPHPAAFEVAADQLGVPLAALVHVGDDPHADGGATDVGATTVLLAEVPLADLPDHLEAIA